MSTTPSKDPSKEHRNEHDMSTNNDRTMFQTPNSQSLPVQIFKTPVPLEVDDPNIPSPRSNATSVSSNKSLFIVVEDDNHAADIQQEDSSVNEKYGLWPVSTSKPRAVSESYSELWAHHATGQEKRSVSMNVPKKFPTVVEDEDESEAEAEDVSIIIRSPSHNPNLNIDAPTFTPAKRKVSQSSSQAMNNNISMEFLNQDGKIQPIPALIGPCSLPYARCPSGIDAFYFAEGLDPDVVNNIPEPDMLDGSYCTVEVTDPVKRIRSPTDRKMPQVVCGAAIKAEDIRPPYRAPPGGHIAFAQSRARQKNAFISQAEETSERLREVKELRKELERVGAEIRRDISNSTTTSNGSIDPVVSVHAGFRSASDALKAERNIGTHFRTFPEHLKFPTLDPMASLPSPVALDNYHFASPQPYMTSPLVGGSVYSDAGYANMSNVSPTIINPLLNPFLNPSILQVMMDQARAHGAWVPQMPISQSTDPFASMPIRHPSNGFGVENVGRDVPGLNHFPAEQLRDPAIVSYGLGIESVNTALEGLGLGKPPLARQAMPTGRAISLQNGLDGKYKPPHRMNQENVNIYSKMRSATLAMLPNGRESPLKKNWRKSSKKCLDDKIDPNCQIMNDSLEAAVDNDDMPQFTTSTTNSKQVERKKKGKGKKSSNA